MRLTKGLAAGLSALVLLSGCGSKAAGMVEEETRVSVITTKIAPSSMQSQVSYNGQVKANESVSIVGKMAGKVQAVYFDIGDRVSEGDVLYALDQKDVQDQIAQLEAGLKTASANVSSAQTGLSLVTGGQTQSNLSQLETSIENAGQTVINAGKTLAGAELGVENAQLKLNDITKTYEDTKALFTAGGASQSQLDSAELAYNQTLAALEQAQIQRDQAEVGYNQALLAQKQAKETYEITVNQIIPDSQKTASNSVATAAAGRDSAALQLSIVRSALNDLDVTSPISGTVTVKNVKAGEMASSAIAAFVVEDLDTVKVDVKVSELIINKIAVGQEVDVYVKTLGDDAITGKIKTISPSADATNMYPVQVEIPNKEQSLKPGMFAQVFFTKEESKNTFVVPRDTVMQDENGYYVYISENEIAKRVMVKTGIDNGREIEIISGVEAGWEVVTTGQTKLIDGDKLYLVSAGVASSAQGEKSGETAEGDD